MREYISTCPKGCGCVYKSGCRWWFSLFQWKMQIVIASLCIPRSGEAVAVSASHIPSRDHEYSMQIKRGRLSPNSNSLIHTPNATEMMLCWLKPHGKRLQCIPSRKQKRKSIKRVKQKSKPTASPQWTEIESLGWRESFCPGHYTHPERANL